MFKLQRGEVNLRSKSCDYIFCTSKDDDGNLTACCVQSAIHSYDGPRGGGVGTRERGGLGKKRENPTLRAYIRAVFEVMRLKTVRILVE